VITVLGRPGRVASQVEKSPHWNWATQFLTVAYDFACSPSVSLRMAWISFGALPCSGGGGLNDSSRLDVVEIGRRLTCFFSASKPIGNRTRDLPARNAMSQSTVPPHMKYWGMLLCRTSVWGKEPLVFRAKDNTWFSCYSSTLMAWLLRLMFIMLFSIAKIHSISSKSRVKVLNLLLLLLLLLDILFLDRLNSWDHETCVGSRWYVHTFMNTNTVQSFDPPKQVFHLHVAWVQRFCNIRCLAQLPICL